MKYLTKEWYELCQRTGLHYDMKVNNGAAVYNEALYLRLYKRKEKEFNKIQHEVYDLDPRFMLEEDGCTLVRLDKFINGEEITDEDKMVFHMPTEDKEHIQKLIEQYDTRPPFDEQKCKEEFCTNQEMIKEVVNEKLPGELLQKIADIRVFSLGYCTKEVLDQLIRISKENEEKINRVLDEYSKAQQVENLPQNIRESFSFHDCKVSEFVVDKNIIIRLDNRGGFTNLNRITFISSETIEQDDNIVGSIWLYEELYRTENGYEAHMLFTGERMQELIVRCEDIMIDVDQAFAL